MSIKIAFYGGSAKLTMALLAQFVEDNHEQVAKFDDRSGRALLTDGTEIIAIFGKCSAVWTRFDQILVAVDQRVAPVKFDWGLLHYLKTRTSEAKVPEEFHMIYYVIQ